MHEEEARHTLTDRAQIRGLAGQLAEHPEGADRLRHAQLEPQRRLFAGSRRQFQHFNEARHVETRLGIAQALDTDTELPTECDHVNIGGHQVRFDSLQTRAANLRLLLFPVFHNASRTAHIFSFKSAPSCSWRERS